MIAILTSSTVVGTVGVAGSIWWPVEEELVNRRFVFFDGVRL
ncbi:hypothetical protein AAHB33_05645 [Paenarthrobacter sp. S56]